VARRHVTTSPRFAIVRIDVTGNERRTPEAIAVECGLAAGANIFAADLDSARSKLLADPWIADAILTRRLPGTLLVRVTERKAAALVAVGRGAAANETVPRGAAANETVPRGAAASETVPRGAAANETVGAGPVANETVGQLLVASADGQPFKRFEPGDPVDLPLVTGLTAEALAQDRTGAAHTLGAAIDLAAEYDRTAMAKRAPLQEVHATPEGAFTLVVGRAAVELALGHPPFRRKLDQATRVVAELDRRGGRPEAILLDNDTRPERVVVRLR
jgi:cell division protein FtsQ